MQLQNLNDAVIEEQEQHQGCIASHLNRCSNDINTYDVDYYSYPNFIGQQELHIFQANICNYHYNKIRGTMSEQLRNECSSIAWYYGNDKAKWGRSILMKKRKKDCILIIRIEMMENSY